MGRLFVTIDTEMDADVHWKKQEPMQFSSVLVGIPNYFRPIWDKYNIYPIYFVSPEVVENEQCCKVLKQEISKGAIIGAHLHPEYIEPNRENICDIETEKFPCYGCTTDIEREKIKNLKAAITKNLGVVPKWYRAARFGADDDTIKMIGELGFKYDSSFTPGIDWSKAGGPSHKTVGIRPYTMAPYSITEFPVTICGKRLGILGKFLPEKWLFYRWLRPTHMTYLEERSMIKELRKKGVKDLVMMFHSMEIMVKKTPYVRNKIMQKYYLRRLEKTIFFAKKSGYVSYKEEKNK